MKNEQQNINAIRFLGVEAISKANSGHPGIVLGASPTLYTLFTRHLNFSIKNPDWINRDRFVLSAGHGSAMIYALMHLVGYPEITIQELKNFRQLGSKTPGHPERHITKGIECTTGPLGLGMSVALGIALNQRILKEQTSSSLINYYTYVLVGDGCLQEGISEETIALAGTWKLNKYIVLYDSNDVQLDTKCDKTTISHTQKRFESQGWNYLLVKDGNDIEAIDQAISKAKKSDKPTIIEIKTIIGFGSPFHGTPKVHGAPLNPEQLISTKQSLGWNYQSFEVPEEVYQFFNKITDQNEIKYTEWQEKFNQEIEGNPILKTLTNDGSEPIINIDELINQINPEKKELATRVLIGNALKAFENMFPNKVIAGSADLAGSTNIEGHFGLFNEQLGGNAVKFGVREFAMAAICIGLKLQNNYWPLCATFLTFADYMKPAIRLAALMSCPVTIVFTHDSIYAGEDGPTHQPIEQLTMLRTIPNVTVFRPCDATEVAAAMDFARLNMLGPTIIIGTRQNLPLQLKTSFLKTKKGAYILEKENSDLILTLAASGSEVQLAQQIKAKFQDKGKNIRVVSIPSFNEFYRQPKKYQTNILGDKNIAFLEAAEGSSYYRLAKTNDLVFDLETFGESAPGQKVADYMKFNVQNIYQKIKTNFNI